MSETLEEKTPPPGASGATEITITDLKNVLVLIDLCTQRGAFRGPELSSVAGLYDKIQSFVGVAEEGKNTSPTGI
jgi:hypothetical protein